MEQVHTHCLLACIPSHGVEVGVRFLGCCDYYHFVSLFVVSYSVGA